MARRTPAVISQLSRALETFDWAAVDKICDELIRGLSRSDEPFPEPHAKTILNLLRRKRRFALMSRVADALLRGGQASTQIVRQYAQAMIDQGNLAAARLMLQSILRDTKAPLSEKAEARGLLGRIGKQLYVDARDPSSVRQQQNLRNAIGQYYDVYKTDKESFLWHGINSAALLARAKRDGIAVKGLPTHTEIASEIQAILRRKKRLAYWDRATAVEAAAAVGDTNAAFDHAMKYGLDPEVDAFEVGSLLRQLTEVWEFTDDKEPGNILLPILRSALLKREGGSLQLTPKAMASEASNTALAQNRLEKVFGTDRYQPLGWLRTGLKRCEAIGRVEDVYGTRIGTGFLVRASDFFPGSGAKELLFLTNAHVISPAGKPYPGAIRFDVARVVFEATNRTYGVKSLVWSSPPDELDATFITVDGIEDGTEICPLKPSPEAFDPDRKPRVYVIGYPLGGGLSVSLQDSYWLDTNGKVLHYRTPTEPGSSGSPVFDEKFWSLIALHHAGDKNLPRLKGSGTYEANEGIAIKAIQRATRKAGRTRAAKKKVRSR